MRNIAIVVGALLIGGIAAFFLWQHNHSASGADAGSAMQATAPAATQPAATTTAATTTAPASTAPAATTPAATTPAATTTPPTQTADASQPALYADDMYMGKTDAKVTVIEYASLSCPHCARFNADVLPQIKANYIDKGLVRWVYRDYPLNNPAYLAAVLAHCASPLRYFSLLDTLFKSQDYWAAQQQAIVPLRQIATNEGVDQKTYDACLADPALKDKIISRLQEASTKYKVEATPSFLVGGELHAGEISYDDFKKLLDAALGHS